MAETLAAYPRLRATRLHEMLRLRGYTGGVGIVRTLVRTMRRETLAGEEAQVDWGSFGTIRISHATRALMCFVMVLSHSRAVFARFYLDVRMESFLDGHVAAFEAFGGAPRKILYDNLKSAVLERVSVSVIEQSSSSRCQSVELRARRETSRPSTMPARPRPTSVTSRWKPSRSTAEAPERPRSESMTTTCSADHPSAMARSRSAYWRWVLSDHLPQCGLPHVEEGVARQVARRDLGVLFGRHGRASGRQRVDARENGFFRTSCGAGCARGSGAQVVSPRRPTQPNPQRRAPVPNMTAASQP